MCVVVRDSRTYRKQSKTDQQQPEVAMKTLDELWYGNVSPFEQCTRGDKRLKELLKVVARNREELDGTLTDKQKETLDRFEGCMNEMHSIIKCDASGSECS